MVLAKGPSLFLLPLLLWCIVLAQTPCVGSSCPTLSLFLSSVLHLVHQFTVQFVCVPDVVSSHRQPGKCILWNPTIPYINCIEVVLKVYSFSYWCISLACPPNIHFNLLHVTLCLLVFHMRGLKVKPSFFNHALCCLCSLSLLHKICLSTSCQIIFFIF